MISPKFARKTLDKGADGLVLVRSGAGGHTGEYAMLPFIDEVRRFFEGPLIVGGGIGSGRAIRAVENLGADFAYLGTRFLAGRETMISQEYREMVWTSAMEGLIALARHHRCIGKLDARQCRGCGYSIEDMKDAAKLDFSGDMGAGSKAWKHVWSAGQGVGGITKPEAVADVVATPVAEYHQAVTDQSQGSRFGTVPSQKDGA
ncbi:nitronate monooxygenase [uncultured Tateyamaria sp.]|uniref:NAD(P)H-dependent flavin oxidoreductase n=1 Tax=uncultured Tateyamaria sp. TaxID=455651 RepID=UPI002632AC24|nr:nitronate monooxygenase [uncultured Tateyamaria sp.]